MLLGEFRESLFLLLLLLFHLLAIVGVVLYLNAHQTNQCFMVSADAFESYQPSTDLNSFYFYQFDHLNHRGPNNEESAW